MRHAPPVAILILLFVTLAASAHAAPSLSLSKGAGGYWSRPVKGLSGHGDTLPRVKVGRYYPKSCAACHAAQYEDWAGARHARSVGAGLRTQLDAEEPGFAASCYHCHAPLRAQATALASSDATDEYALNPAFDERLKATGVNCAVCHLRDGIIWGPPSTPPSSPPSAPPSKDKAKEPGPINPPHAGAQNDLFSDAEFCAACHQLDSGYRLNGKLLMNTYAEWSLSEYATKGITCQGCHMPGRRHLFRGIHDPEMVLGGIDILAQRLRGGGGVKARLKITNSAVGHMFPTYVTPAVEIRGYVTGPDGAQIKESLKKAVIGRRVKLDLSREIFDTRIPPGESFSFDYEVKAGAGAGSIVLEVWVFPDEFYNRFFSSLLNDGTGDTPGDTPDNTKEAELKEALRETESGYLLYRKEFTL